MQSIKLDRKDVLILEILQRDCRIARTELSSLVSLSDSQCFRRLKRLEESRVIERYTISLDKQLIGLDVAAMVMVQFSKSVDGARKNLLALIDETDVIHECYSITGEFDFMLKVICPTMRDFNTLINDTFMTHFISGIHSYMLLDCFKDQPTLPSLQV